MMQQDVSFAMPCPPLLEWHANSLANTPCLWYGEHLKIGEQIHTNLLKSGIVGCCSHGCVSMGSENAKPVLALLFFTRQQFL
jgi:hypothetical protein